MARSDAPNAANRYLARWLPPPRTGYLLVLIALLSVISIAVTEARGMGLLPLSLATTIPYAVAALNLAVAVAGLWTWHKRSWSLYLVASLAGFILIGATTPITAISYGFRLIKPENRIPVVEKPIPAQGFFGETVSGIPKGSAGNRINPDHPGFKMIAPVVTS